MANHLSFAKITFSVLSLWTLIYKKKHSYNIYSKILKNFKMDFCKIEINIKSPLWKVFKWIFNVTVTYLCIYMTQHKLILYLSAYRDDLIHVCDHSYRQTEYQHLTLPWYQSSQITHCIISSSTCNIITYVRENKQPLMNQRA